MQLTEVSTYKDINKFNHVPYVIYKDDPNWIPHLKQDIDTVFDPKKNKYFRHGEATRWILEDNSGKLIGRVAAFVNNKTAKTFKQPTGGMGFFECIDNKEAAFLLFDQCKKWLQQRDMEAMDGPINFGEKDRFWGLEVEGSGPTIYGMNYNPRYYKTFFEEYGFQVYYEQYIYGRKVSDPVPDKYREKAERIFANPKYTFENLSKKNLDKYTDDFRSIYNRAWVKHAGFKGMSSAMAKSIMKKMKPVIDEDLIIYAYHDGEPVAFFISLPELNQIFRHVNGNLNWIGKLKFLYYKWRKVCTDCFGVVFGVVPEFQGRGMEGALIMELAKRIQVTAKYENFLLTWIGDFNPKMIHLVESMGTHKERILYTYRKLFDENAEFERAPIIK